jgi:hypothetical protein
LGFATVKTLLLLLLLGRSRCYCCCWWCWGWGCLVGFCLLFAFLAGFRGGGRGGLRLLLIFLLLLLLLGVVLLLQHRQCTHKTPLKIIYFMFERKKVVLHTNSVLTSLIYRRNTILHKENSV